jgi:PAS domain S-box-containing protein
MQPSADHSPDPAARRAPAFDARIAGGLFVAWLLLAHAGPMLERAPAVRAWYPPAALLAAACLLWGGRALVPIIIASGAALVAFPAISTPLWRALILSAVLKGGYAVAARLLGRNGFDPDFSRPADVARFGTTFIAASGLAALINALESRGAAGLTTPEGLLALRTFWIGDVVAIVALAPAMIVAVHWLSTDARVALASRRWVPARWTIGGTLRVLSIPAVLMLSAALVPSVGFFAYAFCCLPVGWIALAHGSRVAALANVVLTLGAVSLFHGAPGAAPKELETQAFIGVLALTGLLVGSVAEERKRAFALLAESEERYRRLVELLPDPLLVHVDGRVLFANSAAATVLGARSSSSLLGMAVTALATPRSLEVMEQRLGLLQVGRSVPLVHHTLQRLDGSGTVDVESVSIPLSYQGLPAALTVARDVTTRVRLEEELRHAQRMEAVGRLAGGVAHDFNNLLTVIISYSELIMGEVAGDSQLSRDVREIRLAAERAAALTRQLLSFSRRQVLQPAPLDVNEVVRGSETLLRRLIGPEIDMVSRLAPAVGMVHADRGRLEQVMVNLVVNARDAMPNGGIITLETRRVAAAEAPAAARAASSADRFAMIVVRDTGNGMDAETMRRIFDPFFTTKEIGRGTGLGLATVHGIIEQSGGAVSVDSTIGVGSEFRIFLPTCPIDPAAREMLDAGTGAHAAAAVRPTCSPG